MAIAQISAAIALFRGAGAADTTTAMQAELADVYRAASLYHALRAVEEGLRFAMNRGEGFGEAELLRLKGLILHGQVPEDFECAEKWVLDALEVARQRKARSIELRISTDLARLWRTQGKASKAVDLLGPVYESFTEGFGTKDLKEAKALLASLNS